MHRLWFALLFCLYASPTLAQTVCPARPDDQPNTGNRRITYSTGTSANRAQRQAQLETDGRTVTGYTGNGATTIIGSCLGSGTPPPTTPVDCVESEWSEWKPVTAWTPAVCAEVSTQTRNEERTRTVVTPPANGGAVCGPLKETRTVTQPCAPVPPIDATVLFESGWERTSELGCNKNTLNLLDNKAWNDYGGSGACDGAVHDADLVNDFVADGTKSLRVNQKSGNQNGTDFRIVKAIGSQTEITATWKVRYSESWRWAGADHKIMLFTDAQLESQNVYVNWRGGTDELHGRIAVHVIPSDTVFTDPAVQATVGRWYQLRAHIIAGGSGKVEIWMTDCGLNGSDAACAAQAARKLNLRHEAGNQADPNRLNTGQIGGVKPDTTYNDGSNVPPSGFQQWYDSIVVYRGLVLPTNVATDTQSSGSLMPVWIIVVVLLILLAGAYYLYKQKPAST